MYHLTALPCLVSAGLHAAHSSDNSNLLEKQLPPLAIATNKQYEVDTQQGINSEAVFP